MKRRILAGIIAALSAASIFTFTGCDGSSSEDTAYGNNSSKDNNYGGYSKEYWDAARDAWDANT